MTAPRFSCAVFLSPGRSSVRAVHVALTQARDPGMTAKMIATRQEFTLRQRLVLHQGRPGRRGHPAMSGDTFGCRPWEGVCVSVGGGGSLHLVAETRGAAKRPLCTETTQNGASRSPNARRARSGAPTAGEREAVAGFRVRERCAPKGPFQSVSGRNAEADLRVRWRGTWGAGGGVAITPVRASRSCEGVSTGRARLEIVRGRRQSFGRAQAPPIGCENERPEPKTDTTGPCRAAGQRP